jgi:hypothetical protein
MNRNQHSNGHLKFIGAYEVFQKDSASFCVAPIRYLIKIDGFRKAISTHKLMWEALLDAASRS